MAAEDIWRVAADARKLLKYPVKTFNLAVIHFEQSYENLIDVVANQNYGIRFILMTDIIWVLYNIGYIAKKNKDLRVRTKI